MKPKLLLRIAAAFMLFHTAGHTIGALSWKNAPNQAVAHTILGMETNHFAFMGRQVTLASFYHGYGISLIGVLLLVAIFLWLLSNDSDDQKAGKYVTCLAVFLLFLAVTEYIYFFPFAAAISALAGICTLFAGIGFKNNKQVLTK